MALTEATLIPLVIILALGLILPEVFRKFRLPFITLLILIGSIAGPNGLNYVRADDTIAFFGFLGMTFLMLMAGLETDLTKLRKEKKKIITMALLNGLVPFVVGLLITKAFGYTWQTSLLVGIVFISSSVAIIVPSLRSLGMKKETSQLILSAVLLADIASLIALGLIFQNVQPITKLPLPLYFLIIILSLAALFYFMPKISRYFIKKKFKDNDSHETQLRFVIVAVASALIYFSALGVHPILAAFLVGLVLSGVVHKDPENILYTKIHTLGYGIFVPVFFFIVGMEMDLTIFKQLNLTSLIIPTLVTGLILSKLFSGYFGGKLARLHKKDAWTFGAISMTQLTTTLAVTYAASELGILDPTIVTAIILLSIITTIFGPISANYIASKK